MYQPVTIPVAAINIPVTVMVLVYYSSHTVFIAVTVIAGPVTGIFIAATVLVGRLSLNKCVSSI